MEFMPVNAYAALAIAAVEAIHVQLIADIDALRLVMTRKARRRRRRRVIEGHRCRKVLCIYKES
jgi:hypothetical protein